MRQTRRIRRRGGGKWWDSAKAKWHSAKESAKARWHRAKESITSATKRAYQYIKRSVFKINDEKMISDELKKSMDDQKSKEEAALAVAKLLASKGSSNDVKDGAHLATEKLKGRTRSKNRAKSGQSADDYEIDGDWFVFIGDEANKEINNKIGFVTSIHPTTLTVFVESRHHSIARNKAILLEAKPPDARGKLVFNKETSRIGKYGNEGFTNKDVLFLVPPPPTSKEKVKWKKLLLVAAIAATIIGTAYAVYKSPGGTSTDKVRHLGGLIRNFEYKQRLMDYMPDKQTFTSRLPTTKSFTDRLPSMATLQGYYGKGSKLGDAYDYAGQAFNYAASTRVGSSIASLFSLRLAGRVLDTAQTTADAALRAAQEAKEDLERAKLKHTEANASFQNAETPEARTEAAAEVSATEQAVGQGKALKAVADKEAADALKKLEEAKAAEAKAAEAAAAEAKVAADAEAEAARNALVVNSTDPGPGGSRRRFRKFRKTRR